FDFQSAILARLIGSAAMFVGDATNLTPAAPGTFPSGRIANATATTSIRLSRALMLDVSYLFDRLRDTASRRVVYSNNITRVRVAEYFTRAVALRAIVQYNQLAVNSAATTLQPSRNLNYDLLFTYLTTPGTALYVGANYNLANLDTQFNALGVRGLPRTSTLNNTGWQVFTKVSYLLRR